MENDSCCTKYFGIHFNSNYAELNCDFKISIFPNQLDHLNLDDRHRNIHTIHTIRSIEYMKSKHVKCKLGLLEIRLSGMENVKHLETENKKKKTTKLSDIMFDNILL